MTAIITNHDDYHLFANLSIALAKNKCTVTNFDVDTGSIDIKGDSIFSEQTCQIDIQNIFARYLFE